MFDPITHFELSCVRKAALRVSHLQETVISQIRYNLLYDFNRASVCAVSIWRHDWIFMWNTSTNDRNSKCATFVRKSTCRPSAWKDIWKSIVALLRPQSVARNVETPSSIYATWNVTWKSMTKRAKSSNVHTVENSHHLVPPSACISPVFTANPCSSVICAIKNSSERWHWRWASEWPSTRRKLIFAR